MSDALVPVTQDAAELAAEVARLRGDVRRLVGELEARLASMVQLPRRAMRLERRLIGAVRAHPLVALGTVALLVAGAMLLRRR